MSRKRTLNPSWERPRDDAVHSPDGVDYLRETVSAALFRKYAGIAETMFKWEFEGEEWDDMLVMSRDTLPEKYLLRNGTCCVFRYGDKLHILPRVENSEINIYGYPTGWSPVPVGYNDTTDRGKSPVRDAIRDLKLDANDSVLIRNDLFGDSDSDIISAAVALLVDHTLTLNQLQLLARSPFIMTVSEDNLLTAKEIFLSIAQCRPVVYVNRDGEQVDASVSLDVKIDPALFDLYEHWESMLLQQLGISSGMTPKRAQQTEAEVAVVTGDDLVSLRRKEKLWQRQAACDRIKEVFGAEVRVISVIDSLEDDEMAGAPTPDNDQEDQP